MARTSAVDRPEPPAAVALREKLEQLALDTERTRRQLDEILANLDTGIHDAGPSVTADTADAPNGERLAVVAGALATLADLTHKINNPLTSLLGRAQILKLRLDTDPQLRKAADVVEESARRIADHIRELASVVRATRHEIGSEPVSSPGVRDSGF
jgi:signal transduction histidine kinase